MNHTTAATRSILALLMALEEVGMTQVHTDGEHIYGCCNRELPPELEEEMIERADELKALLCRGPAIEGAIEIRGRTHD